VIAQFLNRDVVLDQLEQVAELVAFDGRKDPAGASPDAALLAELRAAAARERECPSGQPGYDPVDDRRGAAPAPLDDYAFISRDPVISLVQSALDEAHDRRRNAGAVVREPPPDDRRGAAGAPIVTDRSLAIAPAPVHTGDRRLFEQFSVTDIQWVRAKIAEGIRLFRDKAPFNPDPAPPVEMKNRVRLVVVGDWGSGIPRAQKIAREMRKPVKEARDAGLPVHVVHLGDVYYSGWGHEYEKRFLPFWPVEANEAGTTGSWCLNGNHDMYSGGHAYYGVALQEARFKPWHRGSSVFSLVNRHWKILALDSAWEDQALVKPQPDWLRDELKGAGGRKTLLFSHHQLFSAYEIVDPEISNAVAPILAQYPVTSWFWGHEHRCVLYGAHENVRFARCLGHGGIPVYMSHGEGDPYPPPATYEYRRFIQNGLERWALFGFAVLDFDGPAVHVRYIDEDGATHKTETIG
jgi:hypothetical protein